MKTDRQNAVAAEMEVKTDPHQRSEVNTMKEDVGTGWRDIESAPRDGSEILVFEATPTGPFMRVGYWEEHGEDIDTGRPSSGWSEADDGYVGFINPTHWMPLPAPPTKGTSR